jgi:hypothetical protein
MEVLNGTTAGSLLSQFGRFFYLVPTSEVYEHVNQVPYYLGEVTGTPIS